MLELSLFSQAMEVLESLRIENDEDPEVFYLEGWAWGLVAEALDLNTLSEPIEGIETSEDCLQESKKALERCLKVSNRHLTRWSS
jgi:hypothetical protein